VAGDLIDRNYSGAESAQALGANIDVRYRDVMHLSGLVLYLSSAASPDARSHANSLLRLGGRNGVTITITPATPGELVALRQQSAPAERENSEAIDYAKRIIGEASRLGVSDIHISSEEHQLVLEYRLDGDIQQTEHKLDRAHGDRLLSALYQSMTGVADALFKPKEAQDANIDARYLPAELYSARIATSALPAGPLMVIRLQYRGEITKSGATLKDLQIEPSQERVLEELLRLPAGLIIMVGPTGSGKTTTLQKILAALHRLTEGKRRIITVEDPVEIPIPGAMQTAVTNAGSDSERSSAFANAVRRTMRLDPDIIMVGEMRDEATAQSTMRAALTGHLAFSTLHAMSASKTLARLADLGVKEIDLLDPEMVSGVLFQALLKRLCDGCKVPIKNANWDGSHKWLSDMGSHIESPTSIFCRSMTGCSKCALSGYAGRTPVLEVIRTDETYLRLSFNRRRDEATAHIRSRGMITIHQHALIRILRGEVDPRDAEEQFDGLAPRLPQAQSRTREVPPESNLRAIPVARREEATA